MVFENVPELNEKIFFSAKVLQEGPVDYCVGVAALNSVGYCRNRFDSVVVPLKCIQCVRGTNGSVTQVD